MFETIIIIVGGYFLIKSRGNTRRAITLITRAVLRLYKEGIIAILILLGSIWLWITPGQSPRDMIWLYRAAFTKRLNKLTHHRRGR